MPEPAIAVSMPAYNVAPYIAEAIESVLSQQGVRVDLVVVDDASRDDTAMIAERFRDRGVRVFRNARNRGISYSHNLVIAESTAPLIAHVDADDVVLPGALAKLAAAVLNDSKVGQAYCDFYPMTAAGVVDANAVARSQGFYATHRASPIDYRRQLIVHGMVVNHLRTYRREVFDAVGGYDETQTWAGDYEMALRMAERFTFARVPEMLYAQREHRGSITGALHNKNWRYWQNRWTLVRRQLHTHGTVLGYTAAEAHALLFLGLAYVARGALSPSATS